MNELNFKIKKIEENIKENSKIIEKKVKEMQNRLKIMKKIEKRFPDGIFYGEFQNNNISGLGIFEGGNGDRYEGEWLNGIGVFYKKNVEAFIGEFKENKRNGFGIEEDSGLKLEGTYKDNYMIGIGIITYKSGDKYIGEIFYSKSGIGKYIYKSNKYFIGEYKDGYRYKGIEFNPEDKGLYEANWE